MKDLYLQEQPEATERRNPASSAGFGEVSSVSSRRFWEVSPLCSTRFVTGGRDISVANCRRSVLEPVGGGWATTFQRRDILSVA